MGSRSLVRLEDVAALDNLAMALWRASLGKRHQIAVRSFTDRLDRELAALQNDILSLTVAVGRVRVFRIRDSKPRTIHAPCFRERVLHHALMAHIGPVLERSPVEDTFACRPSKGAHAAVRRAQEQARRFPVFAKLDVRSYFASIDHAKLRGLIRRRIRGAPTLALVDRIIAAHESEPGKGLPIGALTSQHFANAYLDKIDRLIYEDRRLGLVRYMDDILIFGPAPQAVRDAAEGAIALAREELALTIKPSWQVAWTGGGVPLCGFRIFPDRLLLSRRRQRRYTRARQRWEQAHGLGLVDSQSLQAAYAAVRAITAHAAAAPWRRSELGRRPPPDV